MSEIKTFSVDACSRSEIKSFIETWHYSKSINGLHSEYCFKLVNKEHTLIGAAIFGKMAMAGAYKKYGSDESSVIELRRLCCIDETPKNTESFFIGHCLRWLRKNTEIKTVVSYADNFYNHNGTIYKASNFVFKGLTSPGRVIMFNGKKYHDKCVRTTYNGVLKPFALKIKEALSNGNAFYIKTPGKNIFTYSL